MAILLFVIGIIVHEDICLFNLRKERRFYGHGFMSSLQINYFLNVLILFESLACKCSLPCYFPWAVYRPKIKVIEVS
jgi:hypothetical protein